jgi:uracil-DNA glycosylase family 4
MEKISNNEGLSKEMDKAGLLNGVKSVLQFQRELGIHQLPRNAAIESFLGIDPAISLLQKKNVHGDTYAQ